MFVSTAKNWSGHRDTELKWERHTVTMTNSGGSQVAWARLCPGIIAMVTLIKRENKSLCPSFKCVSFSNDFFSLMYNTRKINARVLIKKRNIEVVQIEKSGHRKKFFGCKIRKISTTTHNCNNNFFAELKVKHFWDGWQAKKIKL